MDTALNQYSVEVDNLTKEFSTSQGNVMAVDNISFRIKTGSICGFVGPNGAGKSTTIKLLLGLLRPSSGNMRINAGSISDPEIRKYIGYMPEKDAFYEDMNAKNYLVLMATLSGLSTKVAKERADELIKSLGLEEAKKRTIGRFSSGMKKKISFAQAIIHEPKILVLDEPTANLDPLAQAQLIDVLKNMSVKNKTTVLICSHHIEELEKLIDSLIVINHGKVILDTTLEDIKTKASKTIEVTATSSKDAEKISTIIIKLGFVNTQTDSKIIIPVKESAVKTQKTIMENLIKNNIDIVNINLKDESLWDVVLNILSDAPK